MMQSVRFLSDLLNVQLKAQDAHQSGGLDHKNASSARIHGCVAIKCSADNFVSNGNGKGCLQVFSGTTEAIKVPIVYRTCSLRN